MPIELSILVPSFSRLVSVAITGDIADRDRAAVESLLADAARVQGVVDAIRAAGARRLEVLAEATGALDPEAVVGDAGRTSRREASRTIQRGRVTESVPQLGSAMADGEVSASHLDAVANALARLDPDQRTRLAADGDWIATIAARCTPEELSRALTRRVRQLGVDDGVARFERQRRAATLRYWVDQISGMMCIHGELDPESGARLVAAIQRNVERLFHAATPDTCPDDERKPGHLRALALSDLVAGGRHATSGSASSGSGSSGPGSPASASTSSAGSSPSMGSMGPEFIVVIDLATMLRGLHGSSRVEITGGVDLPVETLRRLACTASIIPVVLDGAGVTVDVGRSSRLATPSQRRALRAMYPRCAVDGCTVPFDACHAHHLLPWDDGGPSDLANFVPLCSKHHHLTHEGGWKLALQPSDRVLTITLPDGTTFANPPPSARAA